MNDKQSGFTFCIRNTQVWLHFEPRDIWIGVYWNQDDDFNEVYVCILPMLPVRFLWARHWLVPPYEG